MSKIVKRLDYVGIVLYIVGSHITYMYYVFYCQIYHRLTYTISAAFLGMFTIMVSMLERFGRPQYKATRASGFVSLGFLCISPYACLAVQNGVEYAIPRGLYHALTADVVSILGGLIYATRIPERFAPGRCNILFQSHQIMHLLVVVGAVVAYDGLLYVAKHRLLYDPICPGMTFSKA